MNNNKIEGNVIFYKDGNVLIRDCNPFEYYKDEWDCLPIDNSIMYSDLMSKIYPLLYENGLHPNCVNFDSTLLLYENVNKSISDYLNGKEFDKHLSNIPLINSLFNKIKVCQEQN